MGQVRRKGDILTVPWNWGPGHVWLGVKFSRERVASPTVVRHPPIGSCSHGVIDQDQLVAAVVAGSRQYGLHPERIEYVANDSPDYCAYSHCAGLLAQYAANEEA